MRRSSKYDGPKCEAIKQEVHQEFDLIEDKVGFLS